MPQGLLTCGEELLQTRIEALGELRRHEVAAHHVGGCLGAKRIVPRLRHVGHAAMVTSEKNLRIRMSVGGMLDVWRCWRRKRDHIYSRDAACRRSEAQATITTAKQVVSPTPLPSITPHDCKCHPANYWRKWLHPPNHTQHNAATPPNREFCKRLKRWSALERICRMSIAPATGSARRLTPGSAGEKNSPPNASGRLYGIDCLRLLSMIGVVTLHVLGHGVRSPLLRAPRARHSGWSRQSAIQRSTCSFS